MDTALQCSINAAESITFAYNSFCAQIYCYFQASKVTQAFETCKENDLTDFNWHWVYIAMKTKKTNFRAKETDY